MAFSLLPVLVASCKSRAYFIYRHVCNGIKRAGVAVTFIPDHEHRYEA